MTTAALCYGQAEVWLSRCEAACSKPRPYLGAPPATPLPARLSRSPQPEASSGVP
jgi:hypothetical protein